MKIKKINILHSKTNLPIPEIITEDNQKFVLHSLYDPEKEAKRLIKNEDLSGKIVLVLGLGFGYHINEIIKNTDKPEKIIIISCSKKIHSSFIKNCDSRSILEKAELLVKPDRETLFNFLSINIPYLDIKKIKVLKHSASIKLDPVYFNFAADTIKNYLYFTDSNFKLVIKFGNQWVRHVLMNLRNISESYSIKPLNNKFRNVPAIIIGAGPSLEKNIKLLKNLNKKALILSTDTVLSRLKKEDIVPHFVGVADSQYSNYMHIKNCGNQEVSLLSSSVVYPEVFSEFRNSINFVFRINNIVENYFDNIFKDIHYLKTGGSVTTVLYNFAEFCGCDPIIFVGQDLSFSSKRAYIGNIKSEDESIKKISKFTSIENLLSICNYPDIVEEKDIYGNPILTSIIMLKYRNWFEFEFEKSDRKIINATEGGILKKNVVITSLKETINKYINRKFNIHELYHNNLIKYNYLRNDIKKCLTDFIISCKDLNSIVSETASNIKNGKIDNKRLENLNKKISTHKINNVVSYIIQKDIIENLNSKNNTEVNIKLLEKTDAAVKLLTGLADKVLRDFEK